MSPPFDYNLEICRYVFCDASFQVLDVHTSDGPYSMRSNAGVAVKARRVIDQTRIGCVSVFGCICKSGKQHFQAAGFFLDF